MIFLKYSYLLNMETTKNKMPLFVEQFFQRLRNYLDKKVYFFGSVQRADYYPNSSDIDADIFTDNVNSTITKLQHFLGVKHANFVKFIYRLHQSNKTVHGYKVEYKDKENNFSTEISIYNEKDKNEVLQEHNSKIPLPIYVSVLLCILKFFYYQIPIIPKSVYIKLKKFFMNYLVEGRDTEFITTDIPKSKE